MVETFENKYSELVSRALTALTSKTDISQLAPGAKARALIEIVMKELGDAYTIFNTDLLEAFIRYASGDKLDLIGELYGVSRIQATRNTVDADAKVQKFYVEDGTFGSINNDSSFIIPAGVAISTRESTSGQQIVYELTSAVTCNAAATEAYGSIRSMEFGTAGNIGAGTLVEHNFSLYDDYLNNSLKTINVEGVVYAQERESDDAFRYRIINQTLASEQANSVAIRMAALSVPGVADVVLDEYSRGIGTGAVYIKAITPTVSDFLISLVQDAVDRVRAFGNLIEARAPNAVGVEMDITLNLYKPISAQDETDLKMRVRDTLYFYINSLDINEELALDLLVRQIQAVDGNIRSTGTIQQPIDHLYIWRYSAAEDNRVSREALSGYQARNFERIVVEYTELPDRADPIRVRVKK